MTSLHRVPCYKPTPFAYDNFWCGHFYSDPHQNLSRIFQIYLNRPRRAQLYVSTNGFLRLPAMPFCTFYIYPSVQCIFMQISVNIKMTQYCDKWNIFLSTYCVIWESNFYVLLFWGFIIFPDIINQMFSRNKPRKSKLLFQKYEILIIK